MRALALSLGILVPSVLGAQIPREFHNLKFFPTAIPRDSLIEIMRQFSFALGVRCQYCHVGGDGVSFEGVEFHKDDSPHKRIAREMLRMVRRINEETLPALPERGDPPLEVECKTCHRGQIRPTLLKQELRIALERGGVDSAVARYRQLRENLSLAGAYDFRQLETSEFASALAAEGRPRDAIVIFRLNEEFYPRHTGIKTQLGGLYERLGELDSARAYYRRTLDIDPTNRRARARLDSLGGGR